MMARRINFDRNTDNTMIAGVASVVWQTSFATKDGLRSIPTASPGAAGLVEALRG